MAKAKKGVRKTRRTRRTATTEPTVKAEAPKKKSSGTVTIIPPKAPPVKPKVVDPARAKVAPPPPNKSKLHIIKPSASESGTTGPEPEYDANKSNIQFNLALNWYAYVMDEKDHEKVVLEWLTAMLPADKATKRFKEFQKVSRGYISGTYPAIMRMHMRGWPISVGAIKDLWEWMEDPNRISLIGGGYAPGKVSEMSEQKAAAKDSKREEKKVVNIQDHILNQVRPVLAELDALSDACLDGTESDVESVKNLLHNPDFKAPQFRKIADYLEKHLREWGIALAIKKQKKAEFEEGSEEADFQEGYRLITLKQLKNAIDAFAELHTEVKGTIEAVKPVRKKKPRSPDKMVSKMKYLQECTDFGITSIDPKDVLDTSTVFLFNCKRRNLTMLVGEFAGSISVKRSTLIGVNLKGSFTKKLRKPETQLAEFLALRKGGTEKWFNAIKCKPRAARARLNADTVILRAD